MDRASEVFSLAYDRPDAAAARRENGVAAELVTSARR